MDGDEGGVHCDRHYGFVTMATCVQQRSNLIIRSGEGGRCPTTESRARGQVK